MYGFDLHCHNWQNIHCDPVELVKAAPCARLGEALVDVSDRLGERMRILCFKSYFLLKDPSKEKHAASRFHTL